MENITILPILTKIKRKCPEKLGNAWFIYKNFLVISTIYKLREYNFLCHYLDFSNHIKHPQATCLKSGDIFFTSLVMLEFQAKASICSAIKENLI